MLARACRPAASLPLEPPTLPARLPACSVDGAGLQTGDASLNIDAPVVVMTTEILRNMLYRVGDDGQTAEDRLAVRRRAAPRRAAGGLESLRWAGWAGLGCPAAPGAGWLPGCLAARLLTCISTVLNCRTWAWSSWMRFTI